MFSVVIPNFSVVIPNYNGKKFLKKCLQSILENVEKKSIEKIGKGLKSIEIIVVDNGSTDGSPDMVRRFISYGLEVTGSKKGRRKKKTSPQPARLSELPVSSAQLGMGCGQATGNLVTIKLIENDKNLGFAAAVNQGIKKARNDYVVVMNNDLRLEENWFEVMADAIYRWGGKEKIGAYFGTVLNWDGTRIESTGLEYWIRGKAKNRDNGREVLDENFTSEVAKWSEAEHLTPRRWEREEFVWGASASVVVYYKPALMEVGLFDEDFFAYEEDVDLALRLQGAGWKTLYVPKAIAYHLGGGTSSLMGNFRQRMDAKNWWFIIIKNYPLSVLIRHGPEIFVERLRNLSGLLKATPVWRWVPDVIRTYGEVLIKLPRMIKKRKPIRIDMCFSDVSSESR